MGWRPSSWWARSRDRQPPVDVPADARTDPGAEPIAGSSPGAWNDLPVLRPAAAAPVQRVAITDDFRAGLATYDDPRFLRPLTHRVDATIGGLVDGLAGNAQQFLNNTAGALITWILAAVATLISLVIVDKTIGLRLSESEEITGLDLSQHGEEAYNLEG